MGLQLNYQLVFNKIGELKNGQITLQFKEQKGAQALLGFAFPIIAVNERELKLEKRNILAKLEYC